MFCCTSTNSASRALLLAWFAAVPLVLAPMTVLAQSGQGSISGRITDASGAIIGGATVTILQAETGVSNTTKTNGSGLYSQQSLNPGTYTVTVSQQGFKELVTQKVTVSAAANVEVNGQLQLGGSSETIQVTATGDLLSTTSDVSTTVDQKIVLNLPYPERSALEAVLLVPGVTGDTLNPGGISPENPNAFTNYFSPGASITVGGAPAGTTAIIVDGSDVTEASYPRAGLNLSNQVVQEMTVVVAGASAKYGRTGGGAIVQTTMSGTNTYHGGVTYRHTDPYLWAMTPGLSTKTNQHEHFFGAYLGGPVRIPRVYNGKDKTFFFVAVEPARLHSTQGAARGTFLTPEQLAGQFHNSTELLNQSVLKGQGYAAALSAPRVGGVGYVAPHGGSPSDSSNLFPYGVAYTSTSQYQQINGPLSDCTGAGINQEDFVNPGVCHDDLSGVLANNAFARFVASQMPTPSNPGPYITFDNASATPAADLTNGTYKRGVINNDNRYDVRIDHQFNNSNSVYVRYTTIPINAQRFFALASTNPMNQVPTDVEHGYDVSVGYTHVFTSNIVNEVHYSWFRENLQRLPPLSATTTDFGAKYGLPAAVVGYGFPRLGNFNSNGVSYTIQPGGNGYSQQVDQNFIFGDNLSIVHGLHSMQVGVDVRWIQSNQYDLGGVSGGAYSFASTNSAAPNGQAAPVVGNGSAFATFLLGVSGYSNTPVEVPGYYRYKYWAAYFQDDWRITPTVTLNLGMRYEVEVPRTEAKNNQAFVSATPINGTLNGIATSTAFCFSGSCGLQRSLWPTNYGGFEPRVGVSYAPTNRMTVRASYAINRVPLSGQENIPDPDFNVTGSSAATNSLFLTDFISNPIAPSSLVSAYTQLAGNRGPINFSTGLAPVFVDQTNAVPYIQTYGATIQYQPSPKTLVQASYQGVRGIHLYGQFVAKNTPSLGTLTSAIQGTAYLGANQPNNYNLLATNNMSGSVLLESGYQALLPYQNFFNQPLTNIYPRNGDSHYNAMYLSFNQRATKYVTLIANYTWSKSIDNVPDINNGASEGSGQSSLQTPFSLNNEYSVSSFDQDSAFKMGYNIDLPLGVGEHFSTHVGLLDRMLGNFSTAGFVTEITGFPNYVQLGSSGYFYSIQPVGSSGTINGQTYACAPAGTSKYCATSVLPSGYTLRPNINPGVPLINKRWRSNPFNSLGPGGITPYLNSAAFSVPGSPGNPQLGNAPRTLANARSPRGFFFDTNVTKGFTIKDRYRLNLTATLSNAFNHPVYFSAGTRTLISSTTVNTNAGNVNSVLTPVINSSFGDLGNAGAAVSSRVIRLGAAFVF